MNTLTVILSDVQEEAGDDHQCGCDEQDLLNDGLRNHIRLLIKNPDNSEFYLIIVEGCSILFFQHKYNQI